MFPRRELDELDFRGQRANYRERRIDRLRRFVIARQYNYFLLRHPIFLPVSPIQSPRDVSLDRGVIGFADGPTEIQKIPLSQPIPTSLPFSPTGSLKSC